MAITGAKLTADLIRSYVSSILDDGKEWLVDDLLNAVNDRHEDQGGQPSNVSRPRDQLRKAIKPLVDKGQLVLVAEDIYKRAVGAPEPVAEAEAESAAVAGAEIKIGDGQETIYGWYFPAYRKLAEMKGENRFPIKVGKTVRNAENRLRESGGMAPEMPVLGFVLKVDDASMWESLMHNHLKMRGRHISTASGAEWFNTYPDELRSLYEAIASLNEE